MTSSRDDGRHQLRARPRGKRRGNGHGRGHLDGTLRRQSGHLRDRRSHTSPTGTPTPPATTRRARTSPPATTSLSRGTARATSTRCGTTSSAPAAIPGPAAESRAGTPIHVTAGTAKGGIDFALDKGGRIAGKVTDASTTTGLAYTAGGHLHRGRAGPSPTRTRTASATTRQHGPPRGSLSRPEHWYSSPRYINEVHDDKPCLGYLVLPSRRAQPISVSLGATTSGIDFALDKGGQIAGKVTDASTTAGVADVEVDIYSRAGRSCPTATPTAPAATPRSAGGLPTGRYYASDVPVLRRALRRRGVQQRALRRLPSGDQRCADRRHARRHDPGHRLRPRQGRQHLGQDHERRGRNRDRRLGVCLHHERASREANVHTGASGNYTLGGLPTGHYVVQDLQHDGLRGRGLRRSAVRGIQLRPDSSEPLSPSPPAARPPSTSRCRPGPASREGSPTKRRATASPA